MTGSSDGGLTEGDRVQAEDESTPVALRCFPPSDIEFRRFAERAMAELAGALVTSPDGPGTLERALRETYPQSVVRPRTDLAALDLRPAPMWYVYRDGKVIPDEPEAGTQLEPDAHLAPAAQLDPATDEPEPGGDEKA